MSSKSRWLRRVAHFLIRGPDAPCILADLDEDLGMGHWRVTVPFIALGVLAVRMLACVSPTRRGLRIRLVEALRG